VAEAPAAAKAAIHARAAALGFDVVGFAPAALAAGARAGLADFLAAGQHGTMAWLAARAAERGDPRVLWPQARSVICVGLSYAPAALAPVPPASGAIALYARQRDYHDIVKGRLKHLAQFVAVRYGAAVKVFVDTAPVMEKPLAMAAGLGWQGKHTNLVSRRHGSWLLLGEVYTALELEPDAPHAGHCGSCTRCLAACPTGALPVPGRLEVTRCIAYLTIEHAGPIPRALRPAIGNRIYGCDDCLAVCPWNRFAAATREAKLAARPDLAAPPLAALAALDDAGFRRRFAASPIKRIGRNRFVRNVLIAIGNSGTLSLLPAAHHLQAETDPVVAEAAQWAVARLRAGEPDGDTHRDRQPGQHRDR
jgi:epoxyqueuosine reductase